MIKNEVKLHSVFENKMKLLIVIDIKTTPNKCADKEPKLCYKPKTKTQSIVINICLPHTVVCYMSCNVFVSMLYSFHWHI